MSVKQVELEEVSDLSQELTYPLIDRVLEGFAFDTRLNTSLALTEAEEAEGISEAKRYRGIDFATFGQWLINNGAVIGLSGYTRTGEKTEREGETRIGGINGKLVGLTSNADYFKFGIRLEDMGLVSVTENEISQGSYRSYVVLFNDVWHCDKAFRIVTSDKQTASLVAQGYLPKNGKLQFDKFVPEQFRWVPYGKRFIFLKTLIQRLVMERAKFNAHKLKLEASGVSLENTEWANLLKTYPRTEKSTEGVSVKLPAAQMKVIWPFYGEPPTVEGETPEALAHSIVKVRDLDRYLARLRFAARATEYAFFNKGGFDLKPHWIEHSWQGPTPMKEIPGGVISGTGCKQEWKHIVVGKFLKEDIRLLAREYKKSAKVNPAVLSPGETLDPAWE
ncbi:MAG: hypothetical protein ACXABY_01605 [Candidatus Thorarchaeota archaeon]|jgi:hypothetical protein